jgi:hypothetical protein
MYDYCSLKEILENAGFAEIEEKTYGQSNIPNVDLVEADSKYDISLCLESLK